MVVAMILCNLLVLVTMGACATAMWFSANSLDVKKYAESSRMKAFLRLLSPIRADKAISEVETQDFGPLMDWAIGGPGLVLMQWLGSALTTIALMILFLSFMLVRAAGSDMSIRTRGLGAQTKSSLQQYLLIKTCCSSAVAILTSLILYVLQVDLAVFFAIISFILNYIPHVGYTISVVAPLPLLILDESKSWRSISLCIMSTALIHQLFSSILEPRLISRQFAIHPIVIVVSVAFWIVCWGAIGALLSTPLTCVLRLAVGGIRHRFAEAFVLFLEGRFARASDKLYE